MCYTNLEIYCLFFKVLQHQCKCSHKSEQEVKATFHLWFGSYFSTYIFIVLIGILLEFYPVAVGMIEKFREVMVSWMEYLCFAHKDGIFLSVLVCFFSFFFCWHVKGKIPRLKHKMWLEMKSHEEVVTLTLAHSHYFKSGLFLFPYAEDMVIKGWNLWLS